MVGDENQRWRMVELGDGVDAEVGAEGSGLGEVAGPTAMLLRGLAGAPVRRSGVAACQRRRRVLCGNGEGGGDGIRGGGCGVAS